MICDVFKVLKISNNIRKIENLNFTKFWSLNIIMVRLPFLNSNFWISGFTFSSVFFFACFQKKNDNSEFSDFPGSRTQISHAPTHEDERFFVVIPPEQQATRSRTYIYLFVLLGCPPCGAARFFLIFCVFDSFCANYKSRRYTRIWCRKTKRKCANPLAHYKEPLR